MATVRIDAENPHGGWDATNLRTNKSVRIKSAQRLRHETRAPGKDAPKSDEAKSVESVEKADLTQGAAVPTAGKKKRQPKAEKPAKERKPSGLDAAATVLAEAGEPLNTKDMVERMLAKGLWQTGGKTPAATIYAAILREITVKGDQSRFRKTERGKFGLVK
jgi:hypothetical protein